MGEPPCKKCCREQGGGGCLRACLDRVNAEARSVLQQKLEQEKDKGLADSHAFIRNYMRGREVSDNHAGRRRHVVWRYLVPSDGKEGDKVEVCQLAFRKIFNVSERFIRTSRNGLREQALQFRDHTLPVQEIGIETRNGSRPRQEDIRHDLAHLRTICNWSEHQIQEQTLQILFEEGFTSRMALEAINEDDLKYLRRKTHIKPGQISLLRQVLNLLRGERKQGQTVVRQQPNSNSSDLLPEHLPNPLSADSPDPPPPQPLQDSLPEEPSTGPGEPLTTYTPPAHLQDKLPVETSTENTQGPLTTDSPPTHLQDSLPVEPSTENTREPLTTDPATIQLQDNLPVELSIENTRGPLITNTQTTVFQGSLPVDSSMRNPRGPLTTNPQPAQLQDSLPVQPSIERPTGPLYRENPSEHLQDPLPAEPSTDRSPDTLLSFAHSPVSLPVSTQNVSNTLQADRVFSLDALHRASLADPPSDLSPVSGNVSNPDVPQIVRGNVSNPDVPQITRGYTRPFHPGTNVRQGRAESRKNTGGNGASEMSNDTREKDVAAWLLMTLSGEVSSRSSDVRGASYTSRTPRAASETNMTVDTSHLTSISSSNQAKTATSNVSIGSSITSQQILASGSNAVNTRTDDQQVREWHLVRKYTGPRRARFEGVTGIAVCSNGDIVVADCEKGHVHLLSAKCVYKLTLTSPSNDTEARLKGPWDVAVTSHGYIVVVDGSKYVKLFDESGVYSRSFCTLTEDEDPDTDVYTVSVVVSSQGNILVGDSERKLVTIHSETDGNIIGKVNVSIRPWHLAVTSNQTILVSNCESHKVVSVDMSGNTVFSIDTWLVDGEPGARPKGLTCDTEDNIYIVVYPGGYNNTSHIHMYNNRGEYMRCIAKDLYWPWNITWFNESLYVANEKSILIYSTV